MPHSIGLDIGGTKIAGAVYDSARREVHKIVQATPVSYDEVIKLCAAIVTQLEQKTGERATVGVGLPGSIDRDAGVVIFAGNTPCLVGKHFRDDLQKILDRKVAIANDADCAALSEATDGAGQGYKNVFGLILGTGVGGGLVINGNLVQGVNGLTGEFGHLPLPYRETSDGPITTCHCKQHGCLEKSASGPALARLYHYIMGADATAETIAERAHAGDAEAISVLDSFYTTLAKAMIPIICMFDPDVIVVSGGLNNLPRMYDLIPQRWGHYALRPDLKTKLLPAKHGALSGLRGAAWLGHNLHQ